MRRHRYRAVATRWHEPSAEILLVLLRLESDEQAAADLEHRPLDERGLREHQGDRLRLGEARLVVLGQPAEGRAGAVHQRLPADLARPRFEPVALDALRLVIM